MNMAQAKEKPKNGKTLNQFFLLLISNVHKREREDIILEGKNQPSNLNIQCNYLEVNSTSNSMMF